MSETTFLPYALPEIGEEEIAEVVACLRSGWVTTGPRTLQFEKNFAEFIGDGVTALAVNSATAGLHLALEAIGVGPGDEVIVPTYTFTASAEVVRYLGAEPVLVDVDPDTLNLTAEGFKAAITANTKAVIPVHFAGLACEMDEILKVAKAHGVRVIEDAAHALPTEYNGQLIGRLASDITVFSFYANKTMTTGEGGMIVCRDEVLNKRMKVMRLHGINRDAFDRYTSKTPSWYYEIVAPGFKYNMPDLAAAVGLHQLNRLTGFQARRDEMAARYFSELQDLPLILPAKPKAGDVHAWHIFAIRLSDEAKCTRDDFIASMAAKGIGCSVHFIPLHKHPYWRERYKLSDDRFPVATAAYNRIISIPLYTKMTDDDQTRVIQCIREVLA